MHRKTNFLVKLYWDNKYSDSDSDYCKMNFGSFYGIFVIFFRKLSLLSVRLRFRGVLNY